MVQQFNLDTSGWRVKDYADGWIEFDTVEAAFAEADAMGGALIEPKSPFVGGYVSAILSEFSATPLGEEMARGGWRVGVADIHPEALAMILRDCEASRRLAVDMPGAQFWHARQHGFPVTCAEDRGFLCSFFPPLRVYLNDDGKVCLAPTTQDGGA